MVIDFNTAAEVTEKVTTDDVLGKRVTADHSAGEALWLA